MNRCRKTPKIVFIFFAILCIFLVGGVVMLLWNAVMPQVLHTNPINYWQAVGLLILSKILLTPLRPGKKHRGSFRQTDRLREKLRRMTPEQRQEFRTRWKQHFKNDWKKYCGSHQNKAE